MLKMAIFRKKFFFFIENYSLLFCNGCYFVISIHSKNLINTAADWRRYAAAATAAAAAAVLNEKISAVE